MRFWSCFEGLFGFQFLLLSSLYHSLHCTLSHNISRFYSEPTDQNVNSLKSDMKCTEIHKTIDLFDFDIFRCHLLSVSPIKTEDIESLTICMKIVLRVADHFGQNWPAAVDHSPFLALSAGQYQKYR